MRYAETKKMLGLKVTHKQDVACRLLEQQGFRFCIDYGYGNAIAKVEGLRVRVRLFTEYDIRLLKSMGVRIR